MRPRCDAVEADHDNASSGSAGPSPPAFHDADLGTHVSDRQVVIAGWMTHMCVASTTQGVFLRGIRPTIVADATATRSLPVAGVDLDADQVHLSALATIADLYGVVVPSQREIVG